MKLLEDNICGDVRRKFLWICKKTTLGLEMREVDICGDAKRKHVWGCKKTKCVEI